MARAKDGCRPIPDAHQWQLRPRIGLGRKRLADLFAQTAYEHRAHGMRHVSLALPQKGLRYFASRTGELACQSERRVIAGEPFCSPLS